MYQIKGGLFFIIPFNVSGVDETWFLLSLLFIHVATFVYSIVERSIDLNINKAKISLIEEDLKEYLRIAEVIDKVINEERAPSFVALVKDVKGSVGISRIPNARKVYNAVSFFKEKLEKEQIKRFWTEKAEILFIEATPKSTFTISTS